jgi:rare lipoprotein A
MQAPALSRFWYRWLVVALGGLAVGSCAPSPVYRSPESEASRPPKVRRAPAAPARAQGGARQSEPDLPDPRDLPLAVRRTTARPLPVGRIDTSRAYQIGVASYYGKEFNGQPTASGATYNMYRISAAHRVLPLGTRIRVTNLENGRWVDVDVIDRGPYKEGRILDLSYAAALEVEMVAPGSARVMIEIVRRVD